jgi:CyaY protein
MTMDRKTFYRESDKALRRIDEVLGGLELDELDSDLAGDVLTLTFADGGRFVINAHSAAGQIWMAAGTEAWHFDLEESSGRWIASKNGDELMATVARTVGRRLGRTVEL